uniref:Uncharacterized protein n=1 Tax=Arundo donax TaxID=35708 RepID=A0A0A8XTX9_ARUDO
MKYRGYGGSKILVWNSHCMISLRLHCYRQLPQQHTRRGRLGPSLQGSIS